MVEKAPLIQMKGIFKYFTSVCAVNNVDFDVDSGEVHALAGEN